MQFDKGNVKNWTCINKCETEFEIAYQYEIRIETVIGCGILP